MEIIEVGNVLLLCGFLIICLGFARRLLEFHLLQRAQSWIICSNEEWYKELFSKEKNYLSHILEEHKEMIKSNLKILDVGSGPAVNVEYLPKDSHLICLDPNPHFEEHVKKKNDTYQSLEEIHFVRGYAEDMPFDNEEFDIVICTLVMCVVRDLRKSLDEIRRTLKPGGKLVFLEHD